jgi:hypothetical protein
MTKKTIKKEQVAQLEQPADENLGTVDAASDNNSEGTDDTSQVQSDSGSVETSPEGATDDLNAQDEKIYTVVIPFFKATHREEEVVKVIDSCAQYLLENIRFVTIGDQIEYTKDMPIEHIEYKDAKGSQLDILEVLKLAVVSESVSEKFILIEPGTYLIDNVDLCHIGLFKHFGILNPNRYTGDEAVMMKNTATLLRDTLQLAAYDYNTHCPVLLEKEKLTEMFEKCPDILSGKYHLLTIYGCAYAVHPIRLDYQTDGWILPVVSQKADFNTVARFIAGKCFLYLKHFQENVKYLNPFLETK